jgi:hypothetical protein
MLTRNTSYKRYTVVADDDTAGSKELTFAEVGQIGAVNVTILRAGVETGGATITHSGNKLTVADTNAGYALTTGDVIHAIVCEGA